ncbi:MAG: TIGR02186 family protein [Pikeienuella sp.]|uniref:TIGR02186 family protein n=1 Tax=Pikeienuella sp. TaxID=2831957 RepID=UPI00391A1364
MSRLVALLLALLALPAGAAEERVIAALSQKAVGITATFTGSQIFVFGAVERARLPDARDDALSVIVTISGPRQAKVVRKKERVFGLWINVESVEIDEAPSFYAVAASGPLFEVLSHTEDLRHRISIERTMRVVGEAGAAADPLEFQEAAIRLNRGAGVYSEAASGVEIIGRTLFQTSIDLPSNLVEGDYEARVFLLRDRQVLDRFATTLEVRKVGLERFLYTLAHEQSLLYGLLSVLVALLAGWGASEAARLLRR